MLTRTQFCDLTGLSSEDLKNLNRRNQLPFGDTERRRGEYSPFEAFLMVFYDHLVDNYGMSRTKAAFVTQLVAQDCQAYFDTISDTSRALAEGAVNVQEVMAGVAWYPANCIPHRAYVGPFPTIAGEMTKPGPIVDLVVGNASRAAVVLRARAERLNIDISGLWGANG